jgi:hypothetical protein
MCTSPMVCITLTRSLMSDQGSAMQNWTQQSVLIVPLTWRNKAHLQNPKNLAATASRKTIISILGTYSLKGREVFFGALGVRLHGGLAGLPASRANLVRVLLNILDRLENPNRLVNASAECHVVDGGMLDDALEHKK